MSSQPKWRYLPQRLWDVVFPPRCLNCQKFGQWVCPECWQQVSLIATPVCYKCHRLSEGFLICDSCRRGSWLKRLIVCGYWQTPLKELVYGLKYLRARPLAETLGQLLVKFLLPVYAGENLVIVPVPLHRKRLWDRGFNQSELLAKVVARELNQPLLSPLRRRKFTQPQFNLARSARLANVAGAFILPPIFKEQIVGKTVVLVDDILTTGATINECAKILKQNGAYEVWGLVLAQA